MAAGMDRTEDALTQEMLAERAGVRPDEIDRMVQLGILVRREDGGPFADADVHKVSLAKACEEAGLPLDGIGRAVDAGRLSFGFLEGASYRRWATRSGPTYGEAARNAGMTLPTMISLLESMGFAPGDEDERMRSDELEVLPLVQFSLSSGLMDEALISRVGRIYADSLRRITLAETEVYHERMELPMLAAGLTQSEIMRVASQVSEGFPPLMDRAIMAAYRRQQQLAWLSDMVEHVEAALDEAGVPLRQGRTPAMGFLDLAGYTRLTEEQGDRAAAELASSLDVVVHRTARDEGGLPVKWLGDGVMMYFRDPAGAVEASLRLVEEIPRAGLPPAHVGVAAGPVVAQAGDYFGRTVNMASRISARAGAGQVLVNEAVVESGTPSDVAFKELGDVELKGIPRPVRIFEAHRA
jgi:adenylate cyclase